MKDDEWMPCLRHWRDLCRYGEQAYGLEAFAPAHPHPTARANHARRLGADGNADQANKFVKDSLIEVWYRQAPGVEFVVDETSQYLLEGRSGLV